MKNYPFGDIEAKPLFQFQTQYIYDDEFNFSAWSGKIHKRFTFKIGRYIFELFKSKFSFLGKTKKPHR